VCLAALLLLTPCFARAQADSTGKPTTAAKPTPTTGIAITEEAPVAEESYRELNGHVFMPSRFVQEPFSITSFGMGLAGGTGTAKGTEYQVTGSPPNITITPTGNFKDYDFSAIGPSLDLSVRIVEWVAIRGSVAASIFSGTSGPAVLNVGSSAIISGGLGVSAGLRLLDSLRLAAIFDWTTIPSYNILILDALIDSINNGAITGSFYQQVTVSRVKAGLSTAWAPWDFLGLTLELDYVSQGRTGQPTQGGALVALLADFDIMKVADFLPLGLTAAYKNLSPLGSGSDGVYTVTDYVGGLFYTGRRDLGLGLELDFRSFRLRDEQVSSATIFSVVSRYYW
jgi:hypothetical protein